MQAREDVLRAVYPRQVTATHDAESTWVPFVPGPSWTQWDVAAMIGDTREGRLAGRARVRPITVRILDGRLTSDPRRAEFLVVPA